MTDHLGKVLPPAIDPEIDVHQTTLDGRRVVEKTASGRARGRIRREAAALEQIGSSAVVELVELRETESSTTLVATYVGARTLADATRLHPSEILRALREAFRAIAELHRRGWTHGNVNVEHVILGPRAKIRLCSLGDAAPAVVSDIPHCRADQHSNEDHRSKERSDDLGQLVDMMKWISELPVSGSSFRDRLEWRRMRSRLARATAATDNTIKDSRAAATADRGHHSPEVIEELAECLATDKKPSRLRGPGFVAGVIAAAVLVLAANVMGNAGALRGGSDSAVGRTAVHREAKPDDPAPGDPAPDDAAPDDPTSSLNGVAVPPDDAGNLVVADGKIYRIGSEGDQVRIGDWKCDGTQSALVLRPSTGEVFHFPGWAATDGPVDSLAVEVVEGATRLRPPDTGCGPAVIEVDDGSTRHIVPPPG